MAGDHKCPVCQATFTRPQHVARHMRSHTGDRPYKCQHCGDQFARSDLLSRHVNKCHAGDKPPTTTLPTRRKGQHGSSSTRATTSKQACDQCVIATLPCDGANPCAKCVHRKSPCTYVKFQRQTAPAGPGHKHTHSMDSTSSTSSSLSSSIPRADELFLGPPPLTVPSMGSGSEMYYPNPHAQFAFNAGAPGWEDSPNPPSLTLSGSTADSGQDSDASVRYRNPELMRTMVPPGYAPGSGVLPGYYGTQQPGAPSDQWQLPGDYNQYLPAGASSQLAGPSSLLHPANIDFQGGGLYNLHTRRGSVDGYSDGGSNPSAQGSANSSNAHLPLDGFTQTGDQQQQHLDFNAYSGQYDEGQHPPPSRDGRFASSFGLLSLTDGDGNFVGNFPHPEANAPFFTHSAMKLPPQDSTPRPFRNEDDSQVVQATGNSRDRDAEMRELREFWKQYLRTPLTGPSLGQTPKAELLNSQYGVLGDARPTPKRGLSRVASLPSVRTPPDEKMSAMPSRLNQSHIPATPGARANQTTDDLKSYEQAVLARKAPLNLSLAPRKGRLSTASSVSPNASPAIPQQRPIVDLQGSRHPGTFLEPGPNNIPSASIAAVLRGGDGSAGNSSDENPPLSANRPSFKRLPSQTLENTVQKRALYRWNENGAANEEAFDDTDSDADGSPSAHPNGGANGNGNGQYRNMQFPDSLLDRFRRQSAPTSARPVIGDPSGAKEHCPSPTMYAANGTHGHESSMSPIPPSVIPGSQIDNNALIRS